jgi:hypothetical protein
MLNEIKRTSLSYHHIKYCHLVNKEVSLFLDLSLFFKITNHTSISLGASIIALMAFALMAFLMVAFVLISFGYLF